MSRERAELSKKNPYHIPRYRYYELKYFCRQYDDWKKAPDSDRWLADITQ